MPWLKHNYKAIIKSALTVQQCENWCDDSVYTDQIIDEFSEQSNNSDIDERRITCLTEIFRIIPSKMEGNWLFRAFNRHAFGGQLAVKEIKLLIWDIIMRNKAISQNNKEENLETHIQNMRKK